MTNWWTNYGDVVSLSYWMRTNGRFTDVDSVLYFFENPWKYETEWNLMQEENEAEKMAKHQDQIMQTVNRIKFEDQDDHVLTYLEATGGTNQ